MPQAKTEGAANYLSRIRQTLAQTCPRAALSVICFANASSPKGRAEKPVRIFLPYAQTKLVSPSGRDVAQRQRGLAPSLRELDCRRAARLREQPIICHASGKLLRRPASVLLLPSRLAPCHLPQGGRLLFSAQNKNRASFDTLSLGGRWWIRTTEVVDNRFTVCPLWPLGKPPIFACRNRGAGGRT